MILTCPNPACEGDLGSIYTERDERNTSKWYGCVHCDWCGLSGPTGEGEQEAIDLWNSLPRISAPSPRALEWYRGTDTGISSMTIFEVMTGHPTTSHSPPWDRGDFGRCYRLLDKFPEWRERLGEVADRFPQWRPLVDNWETLTTMYRNRDDGMYKYMQGLMGQ